MHVTGSPCSGNRYVPCIDILTVSTAHGSVVGEIHGLFSPTKNNMHATAMRPAGGVGMGLAL